MDTGSDVNQPIFMQLIESKKVREAKLRQKQMEDEMSSNIAGNQFRPEINEISAWIADQKNDKNVFQRLTDVNKQRQMDFDDENCTFQPNRGRNQSLNTSHTADSRGNFSEFLERQKKYIENKENFYNQSSKDDNCSFKPKINVCSEFLVETNYERRSDFKDDVSSRL